MEDREHDVMGLTPAVWQLMTTALLIILLFNYGEKWSEFIYRIALTLEQIFAI